MSSLRNALYDLVERPETRLERDSLRAVAKEILAGKGSAPLIASFLVALRMQGESGSEIEAFVETMLEDCVSFPRPGDDAPIVDTCGTGGDGHHTFNISTTAAFIVAAAGLRVAKHGNRSASSKCGSADVLEVLGVPLEQPPQVSAGQLEEHNFCFLYARQYHPAMRFAAEPRKELGFRTLFNLCGPLSNPARPTHQLVGVSSPNLVEPVANALRDLGARGALVIHGTDGLDEISLTQTTTGLRLDASGDLHHWSTSPGDLGLRPVEVADLVGGGAEHNAAITRQVLEGGKGPHADVVNMNAGAVLLMAGVERDYRAAFAHARSLQESGAGAQVLEKIATAK